MYPSTDLFNCASESEHPGYIIALIGTKYGGGGTEPQALLRFRFQCGSLAFGRADGRGLRSLPASLPPSLLSRSLTRKAPIRFGGRIRRWRRDVAPAEMEGDRLDRALGLTLILYSVEHFSL